MAKIIPNEIISNEINVNVKKAYLLPDLCGEAPNFAKIRFKDAAGGRAGGSTGSEENHSCTLRYEQLSWNPSHSARLQDPPPFLSKISSPGKGGVGKSTVAVQLALAHQQVGLKVSDPNKH